MKKIIIPLFVLMLLLLAGIPVSLAARAESSQQVPVHQAWSRLLKKHVEASGLVNYKGFEKDSAALNAYLQDLAGNPPADGSKKAEKLAYYINLYNAATVKLILQHYPLHSIKDIEKPWDRKWIQVGGKTLSLGEIEHDILRKMDEPRIHFAINCASYSCPNLRDEAFEADQLEMQLQQCTRDFINDPSKNKISKDLMVLSQLFQWYKDDFTHSDKLATYIDPFTEVAVERDARVKYMEYDWSLNESE